MEPLTDESPQTLHTMRGLAAVATAAADWIGGRPLPFFEGLADLLLKTMCVDLIYFRLRSGQAGENVLEVVRSRDDSSTENQSGEFGKALAPWLDGPVTSETQTVANPLGSGTTRIVVVPIGRDACEGVLVAGSQRAGFRARKTACS